MVNSFRIPDEVEQRLRERDQVCAYCGCQMKAYVGVPGCPGDKATIEHLNRHPPFYWPDLDEGTLVIACGSCNSSRGEKRIMDWFETEYCQERAIGPDTVNPVVQAYLGTDAAAR